MTENQVEPYFLQSIFDCLYRSRQNGFFCDLRLIASTSMDSAVADESKIYLHKIILTAASPFFQDQFKKGNLDEDVFFVKNVTHSSLVIVVDWIYGQGLSGASSENRDSILAAGRALGIGKTLDVALDAAIAKKHEVEVKLELDVYIDEPTTTPDDAEPSDVTSVGIASDLAMEIETWNSGDAIPQGLLEEREREKGPREKTAKKRESTKNDGSPVKKSRRTPKPLLKMDFEYRKIKLKCSKEVASPKKVPSYPNSTTNNVSLPVQGTYNTGATHGVANEGSTSSRAKEANGSINTNQYMRNDAKATDKFSALNTNTVVASNLTSAKPIEKSTMKETTSITTDKFTDSFADVGEDDPIAVPNDAKTISATSSDETSKAVDKISFKSELTEKISGSSYMNSPVVVSNDGSSNKKTKLFCDRCYSQKRQDKLTSLIFSPSTFAAHARACHAVEKWDVSLSCAQCSLAFLITAECDSHLKKHHAKRVHVRYPCTSCDKKFKTKSGLKTHVKISHVDEPRPRFLCEECGREFLTQPGVYQHKRSAHPGLFHRQFRCEHCDFVTAQKSSLQCHMFSSHKVLHPDSKRYLCEHCPYQSVIKCHLEKHVLRCHRQTAADRQQICRYCNKSFLFSSELNGHVRKVHLRVRKFPCTECSKSFVSKSHLGRHEASVHKKGEFKVVCGHCGFSTTRKDNLKTHHKFRHSSLEFFYKKMDSAETDKTTLTVATDL